MPNNYVKINTRLQAIRKTTIAFASLFKDIVFIKYDEHGNEVERSKVPLVYGNKEKYIKREEADPGSINEKVQITLPRIEYGLVNIDYDPSRKLNQANKMYGCSSTSNFYVNTPIPYNFNFEVVIYTRNIEDANQIIEYFLPYFYPEYNIRVNFVPDAGIIKNVPIKFNGESEDEDASGSFDSPVRSVYRTLTFTARSYIFQTPKYFVPILETITNLIQSNSIYDGGQSTTIDTVANTTIIENSINNSNIVNLQNSVNKLQNTVYDLTNTIVRISNDYNDNDSYNFNVVATLNTNKSIANNQLTALSWDAISQSANGIFFSNTSPTKITIPSGYVSSAVLSASCEWSGDPTGYRKILIVKNGYTDINGNLYGTVVAKSTVSAAGVFSPYYEETVHSCQSQLLTITQGDYFEVYVYQTTDQTLTVNSVPYTYFRID